MMKLIVKLLLIELLLYFFCPNKGSGYTPKFHASDKYREGHAQHLHYQLFTHTCTQNAQEVF